MCCTETVDQSTVTVSVGRYHAASASTSPRSGDAYVVIRQKNCSDFRQRVPAGLAKQVGYCFKRRMSDRMSEYRHCHWGLTGSGAELSFVSRGQRLVTVQEGEDPRKLNC